MNKEGLLNRMGCRLYVLPSGGGLKHPLETPSGGVSYGKLLYGGIRRYRLLGSGGGNRAPRRAGETIETTSTSSAWLQFGGPLRVYEGIDMGPSALIDVTLLPAQAKMPLLDKSGGDMFSCRPGWNTSGLFVKAEMVDKEKTENNRKGQCDPTSPQLLMAGKQRADYFSASLSKVIGGMGPAIGQIIRRALSGRTVVDAASSLSESSNGEALYAHFEAEELISLGLAPVRGMLLYGPPGR